MSRSLPEIPRARRRYLDIALALTSRSYLVALQQYRAALARRNAVLREGMAKGAQPRRATDAEVAVWEPALARHGATLLLERRAWAHDVACRFETLCRTIGESGRSCLRYASTIESTDDAAQAIAGALESKRALDIKRGTTHAGPHRDTLALTIDGRPLRGFGSAGQQRSASIALRMLEAETLPRSHGDGARLSHG